MKKLALFATLALASLSFGKGWIQEWTPKLPSWESRVEACGNPKPYKIIAADDFILDVTLPVSSINWWGTVSDPKQLERPFYIAIYKNRDGACFPLWDSPVYRDCVKVRVERIDVDCEGKVVYKFFSPLFPGSLNLGPGHFWIQISESDRESYTPDRPDFGWSSHEPIVKCDAFQMDYDGNIRRPLIEPCYGLKVDLAFEVI